MMKKGLTPKEKYDKGNPVSATELAELLAISLSSVIRMVEKGEIEKTRVGSLRKYVFKANEVKRVRLACGYDD